MPKVRASLSDGNRMEEMQELLSPEANAEEGSGDVDPAKISDLKNLILLGKLTETVKIGGFSFELSTLSANEQAEVMKTLMKAEEMDRVLHSKSIAISYCIKKINSVPLSELAAEHPGDSEDERRVAFILDMQTTLVEKIFTEYEALVARSGQEVGFDSVKK